MTNQTSNKQKIDASQLAQSMLEYEKLWRELEKLEEIISIGVMYLQKTQVVGNVRATYSKGRKSFDYEKTARSDNEFTPELEEFHTKTVYATDWRDICTALDLPQNKILFTQSAPSVKIKIETND